MKSLKLSLVLATLLIALSSTAFATDETGADLYTSKTCNACHGADAKTPIQPTYPKLAGQNKEYAIQQMKDIKSGDRNNGQTILMKGIMANVSEDEMSKIAEYVAGLE